MKILLVGNHTCGNRGDGAILRGLDGALATLLPDAELVVESRYPTSSEFLLGRPFRRDPLHAYRTREGGLRRKFFGHVHNRWSPYFYTRLARQPGLAGSFLNPAMKRRVAELRDVDLVLHVGGSFFVDLYGPAQFENIICALIAGVPVALVGHSFGPYASKRSQWLARTLFQQCNILGVREQLSRGVLEGIGVDRNRIVDTPDTAWLVPGAAFARERKTRQVAITLRELKPFDRRLGIAQDDYEAAFARLVTSCIRRGHAVTAFSTCTGIDSYHKDDRMIALRVGSLLPADVRHRYRVAMEELNDVELGERLADYDLLVGTRLHSAIIAMNFGTVAIALEYEHKSAGILAQMGLSELSADVHQLLDGRLEVTVMQALSDLPRREAQVAAAVAAEKARAQAALAAVIQRLGLAGTNIPQTITRDALASVA